MHTPRTLYAIGKGLARRRQDGTSAALLGGIGEANPFVSECRAGLFDCDYQLHMNNASYLLHAEYARWELCAYNGLMTSMYQDKVGFMVGGTAVRFRREIRPAFRKFEVHTFIAHIDERHMWLYHTFRYPPTEKDPGRIRAQVVCQGLAVQNRTVLDPRQYLVNTVGINAEVVEEMCHVKSTTTSSSDKNAEDVMAELMDRYSDMEVKMKEASTKDDERLSKKE